MHRVTDRVRADLAGAERDAEALSAAAAGLVTAAEADASRIRDDAEEAPARCVAAAEDEAALIHERAARAARTRPRRPPGCCASR